MAEQPDAPSENDDLAAFTGAIALDLSKPWWQSKTILAAIASALPPLAHLAGLDWERVAPYAGDIVTIIAALLAIFGRRRAIQPIR